MDEIYQLVNSRIKKVHELYIMIKMKENIEDEN